MKGISILKYWRNWCQNGGCFFIYLTNVLNYALNTILDYIYLDIYGFYCTRFPYAWLLAGGFVLFVKEIKCQETLEQRKNSHQQKGKSLTQNNISLKLLQHQIMEFIIYHFTMLLLMINVCYNSQQEQEGNTIEL